MITKIVAKLKTGSITSVIPFGHDLPSPPYVVVKEYTHPMGTGFFITAHVNKDAQIILDDYIKEEVPGLLDGFKTTSRHGNLNELEPDFSFGIPQLQISNDDGTISKERAYYMPDRLN